MIIKTISVRTLVEFILREGDIDNRRNPGRDNAMQEGARIHKKLQKAQGSNYHAEVSLGYLYDSPAGDISIYIDGRADGIIEGSPVTIDEIKGTYRRVDRIEAPERLHMAQAMCYAFFYCEQEQLDNIDIQITYCNIETEHINVFKDNYAADDLRTWFIKLIQEYEKWVRMEADWKRCRDKSIKKMTFPYEYRRGQKELATNVYLSIAHGKKLFLEAPTGVGKTISTVFPAIKAMGEGKAARVFYLTAKTITRTVAVDTINILKKNGLKLKSVVITAKDKICPLEERICNPDACKYAKGHFNRINDALFDILINETNYSRDIILEYSEKHLVCPFELSLDISLFCDSIICDYNYAFDPHVYLRRFFADNKSPESIFLIDEAHNLIDRGRNMYSAELVKEDFLTLKRSISVYDEKLAKRLSKCNHELLQLKRRCDRVAVFNEITALIKSIEKLFDSLQDYLENHDSSPMRDEVLDFFFIINHFLYIYEIMNDKYVIYGLMLDNGDFALRLFNVDPSDNLKECMKRSVSSVLFSATLLPIQYHKSLLGGDREDYEVYAESTFDDSKRGLFVVDNVTSKYTERSMQMYDRYAQQIIDVANSHSGKYIVFFPSYNFMNIVFDCIQKYNDGIDSIPIVMQHENMNETDREDFLNIFTGSSNAKEATSNERNASNTLIGFCVLGGVFSEGIDLKNDSLIGAMIVGTGIPQVCPENQIIKDYFDSQGADGMQYAYIIPGFNKVLQAAGRVIRTHEDVGIVVLMDYRFRYTSYRNMFPREWRDIRVMEGRSSEAIQDILTDFWSQHK